MTRPVRDLPHPADFPAPPNAPDRIRWAAADAAARPARLARLRARLAADGVDAYFGIRPEHMRYLTGFALDDGEDRVAGNSGRFVVSGDEVVVLADSRYRLQARAQATGARIEATTHDLAAIWPELMKSLGARRVAVESALVSHELWRQLESAAPRVELVEASGWVEAQRAIKEPAEIERIRAACAVADRSLAALLRRIKPGQTERELALALEWEMRTGSADSLAFGIACAAWEATRSGRGQVIDAAMIDVAGKADLVYGPLVDAQEFPEGVDVTIVEGAVSSQEDLKKLQKIRSRTRTLVALGDCAVTSNVSAMRNGLPVQKMLQSIYVEGVEESKGVPTDGVPALLAQARPVREFVKVDLHVPGCPPAAKAILSVLGDLLAGRKPDVSSKVKFG